MKTLIQHLMDNDAYIPKENLVVGREYLCNARNFLVGRWTGEHFAYVRYKFGNFFQDREFHWDDGPPYGTVKPYSEVN